MRYLSHLSVSTRAVIGQFSVPYSPVQFGFVNKLLRDLSQSVLNCDSKQKFKTLFYSKLCIKVW